MCREPFLCQDVVQTDGQGAEESYDIRYGSGKRRKDSRVGD